MFTMFNKSKDTVDSIVQDFMRVVDRLNVVEAEQESLIMQKEEEITALKAQVNAAEEERNRAKAVAVKLKQLIS